MDVRGIQLIEQFEQSMAHTSSRRAPKATSLANRRALHCSCAGAVINRTYLMACHGALIGMGAIIEMVTPGAREVLRMKHRLLVVALLVCGTAQASDWVEIWHGSVMVDYLDVSRPQFSGDIRSGWFKVVMPLPANIVTDVGKANGTGKYAKELMGHKTYDCRQETVRLDSAARYFSDGTSDSKYIPDALFEPVLPDTLEEAEMKFICDLKPP